MKGISARSLVVFWMCVIHFGYYICESAGTNYCAASLCKKGTHIACGNNGAFSSSCPSNARMINLQSVQADIVNTHNKYRNTVAGGGIQKLSPATRMASMRWNSELAKLAALNVKQCRMQHDQCRNTLQFPYSGQNLAMISWTGTSSATVKSLVAKSLNLFYREYKYTSMSVINSFKLPTGSNQYGHFTAMMAEKNTHVGCGASRFKVGNKVSFLLACNYAFTNIMGKAVYTAGTKASGCTTGTNSKYPNLCSLNESYNVKVA